MRVAIVLRRKIKANANYLATVLVLILHPFNRLKRAHLRVVFITIIITLSCRIHVHTHTLAGVRTYARTSRVEVVHPYYYYVYSCALK